MVPGILVLLITVVGLLLSSMNIVKEKEIGTIEQINVTPIRKHEFIIGKLLPFWLIGLFELAFGLFLGRLLYGIPLEGSLPLLFAVAGIYLLVILGFGLLVSTITDTQQQAMFIAWFFMVFFILMSGLFTPIDSMPHWAQQITTINPVAHFVEVMRRVLMKGAGFSEIIDLFGALLVSAVVVITLSVWRYRKTA
jgi:ABC-2 type transport system permease protein